MIFILYLVIIVILVSCEISGLAPGPVPPLPNRNVVSGSESQGPQPPPLPPRPSPGGAFLSSPQRLPPSPGYYGGGYSGYGGGYSGYHGYGRHPGYAYNYNPLQGMSGQVK